MDLTNLRKVLPTLIKHRIVPYLWGDKGIGKTQTIKQYAKENGLGFVHLHVATQEVGDLVGLLIHTSDGKVRHARPEWMPTEGKGIIFLDELNRMHPDVMQALFSFITERTIHTHKLGDGWAIVAAGNYENGSFNVTSTIGESAWMSRFCHIDVRPTVAEFVEYAERCGNFSVASFIRNNPNSLRPEVKEGFDKNLITPDARSWNEWIGALEKEDLGDNTFEVYSGLVGLAGAAAFMADKKKQEKAISIVDVLERYSEIKSIVKSYSMTKDGETRFDVLNNAVDELMQRLETDKAYLNDDAKITNLKDFLLDVPLELAMKAFNLMSKKPFKRRDAILNDVDFVSKIVKKEGTLELKKETSVS